MLRTRRSSSSSAVPGLASRRDVEVSAKHTSARTGSATLDMLGEGCEPSALDVIAIRGVADETSSPSTSTVRKLGPIRSCPGKPLGQPRTPSAEDGDTIFSLATPRTGAIFGQAKPRATRTENCPELLPEDFLRCPDLLECDDIGLLIVQPAKEDFLSRADPVNAPCSDFHGDLPATEARDLARVPAPLCHPSARRRVPAVGVASKLNSPPGFAPAARSLRNPSADSSRADLLSHGGDDPLVERNPILFRKAHGARLERLGQVKWAVPG